MRPFFALVDVHADAITTHPEALLARAYMAAHLVQAVSVGTASGGRARRALVDVATPSRAPRFVVGVALFESRRAAARVGPRRVCARRARLAPRKALGALVDVNADAIGIHLVAR